MFKKVKTRLFNRYLFSIFCVVAIAVILVTLLIFTIYANLQVSSAPPILCISWSRSVR